MQRLSRTYIVFSKQKQHQKLSTRGDSVDPDHAQRNAESDPSLSYFKKKNSLKK